MKPPSLSNAHHDVVLRPGDGGQHVDAVCGEVSSLLGSIVDAVSPARVHHVLAIVLVQNDQIPLGETQEGGVHPRCQIQEKKRLSSASSEPGPALKPGPELTWVRTVQQSHHVFGPLPQPLQEGDHQVPDVLCIVGGERVLVSFDGGQCKTLTLQLSSSGKVTLM